MDRLLKNPAFFQEKIQKLLIRSTNWIGDAVMTTPAVRAVRENFPNASISLLAKPWVVPVFENSPHIDEIIPLDLSSRLDYIKVIGSLKKRRFDGAILLQNAFGAALMTALANIPIRIGYDTDGRAALLTHAVRRTRQIKKIHQVHYYLNILEASGLRARGNLPELFFSGSERDEARESLKRHGISDQDLVVGINPSATYGPAKQWLPERFARLSDMICDKFGARTLVFGGPKDQRLGRRITRMMRFPAADLSGRTNLAQAMALIDKCDLFITNDSGLMHVAAACKTPLVAIFGSTDYSTTGPFSPKARIVRSRLSCSPCLKRDCPLGHTRCMEKIPVEKVFDVAARILKKNQKLHAAYPLRRQ